MQGHEPEIDALVGEAELPVVELDLPPLKRGDLAEPQPGEGEQEEDELFAFVADRGVDLPQLFVAVGRRVVIR